MSEKKYIIIEKMIKEGSYTKAQLMEAIKTDSEKTFEAQLRFMRIRDNYVLPNQNGIYCYCSEEEWEEYNAKIKAANKKKAKPKKSFMKDPTKKMANLYTMYDKKMEAVHKAQGSFDRADQLTNLVLQEKQIQFSIVKLKINRLRAQMAKELGISIDRIDMLYGEGALDQAYADAVASFKKSQEAAGDKPPKEADVEADGGLNSAVSQ